MNVNKKLIMKKQNCYWKSYDDIHRKTLEIPVRTLQLTIFLLYLKGIIKMCRNQQVSSAEARKKKQISSL